MILELPYPPKELNPNNKMSWGKRYRFKKKYRRDCGWLAKTAPKPKIIDGLIPITLTLHYPDRRKRDADNAENAFKAGRDGLADAWGVDDNIFRVTRKIGEVVKGGKITIEYKS